MRLARAAPAASAFLVAIGALWFNVAPQRSTPAHAATPTVNVGDNWYSNSMMNNCGSPCVTNINVGDTVHWVWTGNNMHSTTADAMSAEVWNSDNPGHHGNGFTFDHTFTMAGTYNYHCNVHSSMHGTIIVGPAQGGRNGDVNCSGGVDAIDAALMLQFSAGLVHSLSCQQNGDVNGDGQINSIDAALVLQFSAGLIGHLPT